MVGFGALVGLDIWLGWVRYVLRLQIWLGRRFGRVGYLVMFYMWLSVEIWLGWALLD